jgi:hypothetical protein
MTALPDEIVAGMTPILAKYGIAEKTEQGKVMVAIGHILRRSDMDGLARKKYDMRDWTFKVGTQIMGILSKHGVRNLEQRMQCSKEILEFIAKLVHDAAGEEKERLK